MEETCLTVRESSEPRSEPHLSKLKLDDLTTWATSTESLVLQLYSRCLCRLLLHPYDAILCFLSSSTLALADDVEALAKNLKREQKHAAPRRTETIDRKREQQAGGRLFKTRYFVLTCYSYKPKRTWVQDLSQNHRPAWRAYPVRSCFFAHQLVW